MKRLNLNLLALTVIAFTVFGCKNGNEKISPDVAENVVKAEGVVLADGNYTVDTGASVINWKGTKPTGSHHGTVALKSGDFTVVDGKVESGNFVMDMSTITDADGSARLEGHLKSEDFFDIEKWPTATFEVTGMNENNGAKMLQGNLTMKDATNPVSFHVKVEIDGDAVTITSRKFSIDRSKWNVRYGSKSFFDDLGDKFIDNTIDLNISVTGNKAH